MTKENTHRPAEAAPMIPAALAMAAGVVADRLATPWGTATWASLAALLAVGAAIGLRHRWGAVVLAASLAAVGGGWHHHRWSDLAPDDLARGDLAEGRPAWVRGVVEDVATFRPGSSPRDKGSTRAPLLIGAIRDRGTWRRAAGTVLLRIGGDRTDLEAGSTVEAAGRLAEAVGPLNPGEFDARDFLRAQGIRLTMSVDDPEGVWGVQGGPGWSWTRVLGRARAWSYRTLVGRLDPKAAPLAAALLLGRREGVDPEVNDAFARTGTTHLLAISGLHLQVLAGVLWVACRAAGLRRPWAFAVVIAATAGYAGLVGLAPSVVRSAAMTIMACLAGLRDRCARPANALALAALATIALNPAYLFDVGCQLSFLAVAMIVRAVGPTAAWVRFGYHRLTFRVQGPGGPLDRLERSFWPWWRRLPARFGGLLFEGVVLSLVIWLAALPLVMLRFHLASPVGVLLNVPLIPLTSLALLAAGLTLPLAAAWGPLARAPGWACAKLIGLTEWLVRAGASWRWGHWFVAGPPGWWVIGFYAGLGWVIAGSRRRGAAIALGAWVALGLGLMARPDRPATTEAEVLAVGHGLAAVVRAPDGRAILYDCGKMADPHVGRRIVAPALWARGVRRLDAVILSHADSDHYDGLPDLLDRIPVGAVLVPPGFAGAANPGAVALVAAIRSRGVPIRTIAAGGRVAPGWDGTLTVLHPPGDWRPEASSDNARSVVLDVAAGGRHLLLTGDLEGPGLPALLAGDRPGPDAILAPHHGGRTANPPALYRWADRATVLVSQRRGGAGARDPLAALEARGVPVLRTWRRGAIRLRWSAAGLEAAGFLDPAPAMVMPDLARIAVGLVGFALGGAACFALAVVEWGAWTLAVPGSKGPGGDEASPPPWGPIEARAADGMVLRGAWRPAEGPAKGLALLLHGFGERGGALRGRAEALARLGWAVAVPDARAQGLSGGDRVSFGGREAGDAHAWLDALADRAGQGSPVVAWGRSMGAAVAVRAASADPRIAALILEAPYPDLADAVAAVLRRLRVPLARAWAGPMLRRAGRLAGVSLATPRPIDVAPSVRVPVLILHGSADPLVPLAAARRLAAAFPGLAEVVEVAGAKHQDVFEVGGAELVGRVADFLGRAAGGILQGG